ncbi:hypothetical protein Clacol_006883 [Clathrus columnatus]|uniref:Uncharacterized protein n=1 Tax=Clathrus columnatus TaxID=1419009 RepID=A0AAV5AL37_9AGAM|nr:hypothetical protein Clacol_006883 [Clathrus columnatus]
MSSIEELEAVDGEICEAIRTTQIKVDIVVVSDVDDFRQSVNLIKLGNHSAKLKMRLNMLVRINRLPAELLAYIVILTYTPTEEFTSKKNPYVSYTWWILYSVLPEIHQSFRPEGQSYPSIIASESRKSDSAFVLIPSLNPPPMDFFDRLLSVLVTSDRLETLECDLDEVTSMEQLAQILSLCAWFTPQ